MKSITSLIFTWFAFALNFSLSQGALAVPRGQVLGTPEDTCGEYMLTGQLRASPYLKGIYFSVSYLPHTHRSTEVELQFDAKSDKQMRLGLKRYNAKMLRLKGRVLSRFENFRGTFLVEDYQRVVANDLGVDRGSAAKLIKSEPCR